MIIDLPTKRVSNITVTRISRGVLPTKWRRKTAAIDIKQNYATVTLCIFAFSALTLLVGRQEGHLACKKLEWWGYLSAAMCRLAYGPEDATATHCLLLQ